MYKGSKFLLAALAALVVLAFGSGIASANRSIEASVASGELGRITATSARLTFTDSEATFRIVCQVVLTISLNRSVSKTRESVAGRVNAVEVTRCEGGTVSVLTATLPWTVQYISFAGTLPNITSLRLRLKNVGFLVSAFFGLGRCLYGGDAEGTTGGGTTITELRADESRALGLVTNLGGFECPAGGVFRGTFTVAPNVRLRLI